MNKFIFGILVAGSAAAVGYVAAQAIKGKKSSTGYDDDDYDDYDVYDNDENIDFEITDNTVHETSEENAEKAEESADEAEESTDEAEEETEKAEAAAEAESDKAND